MPMFFGSGLAPSLVRNLGIAIRQKSQVMLLLMFVIISFLDEQKLNAWKVKQARKKKMERMKKALAET